MYSQDPFTGFYTGNGPINPSYDSQNSSTFTPNIHLHQLYAATKRDNNNSQQTYQTVSTQSNNNNNNQQSANTNVYNFENGGLASTEYYNRVHAQKRSNTPANGEIPNSSSVNTTNSNVQRPYNHSSSINSSTQPTPAVPNGRTEPTFLVVPGPELSRETPLIQVIVENIILDQKPWSHRALSLNYVEKNDPIIC